jgi:NAD(P)-dependent dehydrogenase (short-subunit alcohol dehydrogenase family)
MGAATIQQIRMRRVATTKQKNTGLKTRHYSPEKRRAEARPLQKLKDERAAACGLGKLDARVARAAWDVPLNLRAPQGDRGGGATPLLDAGMGKSVTRLSGKVALITGGGTGIGRATALAFAREGASVTVAGRRLEKLREVIAEVQKQGGAGLAMECDVTRARDVERAVKGTVERFGRLNVLVNNAGALHVSTVEGITEEEWDRVMAVNVKGPFLMSRAVLAEFRKCGGGAIVNIGSVLGLVAMKDRAAYCASKGGVTMLTKAMAIDHGHENVRVNCICPSIVETELVKGLFDASEKGQALRKGRLGLIPLERFGQPGDVAEMAVFLASEESSWLTGAAIPLDGGLTAY